MHVTVATADGTATVADHDYEPTQRSGHLRAGQTVRTVTVLVDGDTKLEDYETFTRPARRRRPAPSSAAPTETVRVLNDERPSAVAGDVRVGEGGVAAFRPAAVASLLPAA